MSQRKVQDTIAYLEKRGLIKKLESRLGGPSKGSVYQVPLPVASMAGDATVAASATTAGTATAARHATTAPDAGVAAGATNKDDDDEKNKNKSSSKGGKRASGIKPVENHNRAAAPRERHEDAGRHFLLVRDAYEKATGNEWNDSDSATYEEDCLVKVPAEKIVSTVDAVARRTLAKVNSFRYFVKEIVAAPDPRNRAWQKKRLEAIARKIRDNGVGRDDFSTSDFVEDVKRACAREGIPFDNDLFNHLAV